MVSIGDHDHATSVVRADVYARQSHGRQASVEDQIKAAEDRCSINGWSIRERRRDKVSASRFGSKSRDEWPELVADVNAEKLDVVILWDASRGDRTPSSWTYFLECCREHNVKIHAIRDKHTYDLNVPRDWKTLHDAGTDAGYESEVRSADTRRGTASAAIEGKPHGKAGYGYTRVYDAANRKVFRDVPNEAADVAREIITRLSKRDPVNAVTQDLNDRGILSPSGRPWSRKGVKAVATSVRYIGKRSHHGELHQAAWPAIVAEDVFWRCQAVLAEPDRRQSAPGSMQFLLSYFMTCSKCKLVVNVNAYQQRARPRYKCSGKGCMSIGMWEADEYIMLLVLERLSRPDARAVFASGKDELEAAQADIGRLESDLHRARESFANDVISDVALGMKEKRIGAQLEEARRRAQQAVQADAVLDLLGEGEFTVEIGRPRWKAASMAARRMVVKTLFAEITLEATDVRLSAHATDEERMDLASDRIAVEWP